jgi:hypothetical protein
MLRRLQVEALVAPGHRKIVTSALASSVEDVLAIARYYHGKVERPWVFDANTDEVLYRWSEDDQR